MSALGTERRGRLAWRGVQAVLLAAVLACQAGAQAADEPAAAAAPHRHHHAPSSSIDYRIQLLTAELGLDARQQQAVRQALESQREQVARAWADPAVPSAVRVKSTQAIGDRTADQIRAVLTEEQRARYIKPRQQHAAAAPTDVQALMNGNGGRP